MSANLQHAEAGRKAAPRIVDLPGTGGGVRIGVIDSGWDRSIADARIEAGIGFADPGNATRLRASSDDHDRLGHGTSATDLILQIAPSASVVPIRVFGRRLETSPSVLVAALYWAVERRLHVVNLSLGTLSETAVVGLYRACEYARTHGTIVVAAATNDDEEWSYPAVFESVIGVGGGEYGDAHTIAYHDGDAFECRANPRQRARRLGGTVVDVFGTSVAVPIVTGYVARALEQRPRADVDEVRRMFAGR